MLKGMLVINPLGWAGFNKSKRLGDADVRHAFSPKSERGAHLLSVCHRGAHAAAAATATV